MPVNSRARARGRLADNAESKGAALYGPYVIVVVLSIICAGVVFSYGRLVCASTWNDPLTLSYFPSPWSSFLDGWGLLHFAFYAVLTLMFPRLWWLIFIIGVAWESLEYYMNTSSLTTCVKNKGGAPDKEAEAQEKEDYKWWYARWQDIVMNTFGIAVGLAVRLLTG